MSKALNIWRVSPVEQSLPEGELLVDNRLLVGCGGGSALELLEVQPEGKKECSPLTLSEDIVRSPGNG